MAGFMKIGDREVSLSGEKQLRETDEQPLLREDLREKFAQVGLAAETCKIIAATIKSLQIVLQPNIIAQWQQVIAWDGLFALADRINQSAEANWRANPTYFCVVMAAFVAKRDEFMRLMESGKTTGDAH